MTEGTTGALKGRQPECEKPTLKYVTFKRAGEENQRNHQTVS